MKRILMGTAAIVALGTVSAAAQESVKIGFVSTFSGPTASGRANLPRWLWLRSHDRSIAWC